MHTLNDFGANQGAFCHDTLEGHHVVQLLRSQSAGVTGEFTKGSHIGTVVVLWMLLEIEWCMLYCMSTDRIITCFLG